MTSSFPLSHGQQALWFIYQEAPESSAYNMALPLQFAGEIKPATLQQAVRLLVEHHPTLRTLFGERDGVPYQQLAAGDGSYWQQVNATGWTEKELMTQLQQASQQPFFLEERGFLATLFQGAESGAILLFTLHNIVGDAASLTILGQQLLQGYAALADGKPETFAPLTADYGDYIRWEVERLDSDIGRRMAAYWQKQLAGEVPVLQLPTDSPRPQVQTFNGASLFIELPNELTQSLKALAKAHKSTLFTVLLSAYQVLLHRYSGQKDIWIGVPTSIPRNQPEFADIVGYLVNLMVVRTQFPDGDGLTFNALMQQNGRQMLAGLYHQPYPFSWLIKQFQSRRDPSYPPLVQVMFAMERHDLIPRHFSADNMSAQRRDIAQMEGQFDISLTWSEDTDGKPLSGILNYNRDLFSPATIERMAGHFEVLLTAIIDHPEQTISQLPMLSAQDVQQLQTWNDTVTDYPQHQTLIDLFEQQVDKTPGAIALVFEAQSLSYQQLNAKANQLAHYLLSLNASSGKALLPHNPLIGIAVERSLEMIIGLLAILKAGGAYVPIDPSYPAARIRYMLEDSAAPVLLTQGHLSASLPLAALDHECVVVCLDEVNLADQSIENPPVKSQAEDLAYVIYTSGSTGKPKGVMLGHTGLCNLVTDHIRCYGIQPHNRVLQFVSLSFDVATADIFMSLCAGAALYLPPPVTQALDVGLAQLLRELAITHVQLPAPVLAALPVSESLPDLEVVATGGEVPAASMIRQWAVGRRYFNVYGPTEATICVTMAECRGDARKSPIGSPIANTQIYILDEHQQSVPVGVAGELYIGGVGLARGYMNQPQLTAEKFVSNPFSTDPSDRLYKSGDLARYLPDGNLEFLGRIDHQIKIRGFRIELDEIEVVLEQYALIEQCAVICTETADTHDKRLIAYIVPSQNIEVAQDGNLLGESSQALTAQWEQLYNDSHSQAAEEIDDLTFNIKGWNSNYTGGAIPDEEIRGWVDTTVATIRALNPIEVLEIGCGTALLLSRIAPHTQAYWGCDFSPVVLQQVEQLKQCRADLSHVVLKQRTADNFDDIQSCQFDTVVINSVIQYFPSVDYLINVLEQAIDAIKPGGHLFVGDVRNLPLLRTFYASVQAYQASDDITQITLSQLVAQQQFNDKELVVDPRLFIALSQQHPRVTGVKIRPHRGFARNELIRFRYQVILEIEHPSLSPNVVDWQDWQPEFTLNQLRRQLAKRPATLGLRGVSNARLESETAIVDWLDNASATETLGELRQRMAGGNFAGLEPEALWQLGKELDYDVDIDWQQVDASGHFDVLFKYHDDEIAQGAAFPVTNVNFKAWRDYANNPLQAELGEKLIPQLREYLNNRLPEYMIPSAFVLLGTLPLTPNGKIDRQALAVRGGVTKSGREKCIAPRTHEEKVLALIWIDILGLECVGIYDNFFEMGGDSLKGVRLVSKLQKEFSQHFPLAMVFRYPTLAEFATQLANLSKACQLIQPVIGQTVMPLSFSQEEMWRDTQDSPYDASFNSCASFQLNGQLNLDVLRRSFEDITQRHTILRTKIVSELGEPVQIVVDSAVVKLSVLDLSRYRGQEQSDKVESFLLEEGNTPFDLETAPLWRVSLLRLEETSHMLTLSFHHIIGDGWSLGILLQELTTLYTAFASGQPSPLKPLAIQYADFAHWQRQFFTAEVLQSRYHYWQALLADKPALLILPTDKPYTPPVQRQRRQTYRGDVEAFELSPALTQRLRTLSQHQGSALSVVLLAAYVSLLYHYSGQQDMIIGMPISNRDHHQVESLIGYFSSTSVLHIRLPDEPDFLHVLARVKEAIQSTMENQDLSLKQLWNNLQLGWTGEQQLLFRTMFNFIPMPGEVVQLPGVTLTSMPLKKSEMVRDLNIALWDKDGSGTALAGFLRYRQDLFEVATIKRMVQRFQSLLEAVADKPEQPIDELLASPRVRRVNQ